MKMKKPDPKLKKWIKNTLGVRRIQMERLRGDASERVFWRVITGQDSYIVMDTGSVALWPWLDIHALLRSAGFRVPEIIECSKQYGWTIQEDLGSIRVLDLPKKEYTARIEEAIELMFRMQRELTPVRCENSIAGKRKFTPSFFMAELEQTLENLFFRLLNVPHDELLKIQAKMRELVNSMKGVSVFTHRDFHSANLMMHKEQIYMVDWQDARFGPPEYDMASLLRDSYFDIGPYWEELAMKFVVSRGDSNIFQVVLCAFQRNLKAVGTFAYMYRAKDDPSYLNHLPRTFRYLEDYARLCPMLKDFVGEIYRILEGYSGEIDLWNFRESDIVEIRQK